MKKTILILASAVLIFSACKKEGCMDQNARNYDAEAEKDGVSCLYDGSAIFWINANTSINYQNSGINELKIYVDDEFIGIMSTNSSLLEAPSCENGGGVNHYEDLINNKSRVAKYKATYVPFAPPGAPVPDEVTESEGSFKLEGGNCISFQLQ